jgi:hypothetical protein
MPYQAVLHQTEAEETWLLPRFAGSAPAQVLVTGQVTCRAIAARNATRDIEAAVDGCVVTWLP